MQLVKTKISIYEQLRMKKIPFTKPIYESFFKTDMSTLIMYHWFCDIIQPYFGEDYLE